MFLVNAVRKSIMHSKVFVLTCVGCTVLWPICLVLNTVDSSELNW